MKLWNVQPQYVGHTKLCKWNFACFFFNSPSNVLLHFLLLLHFKNPKIDNFLLFDFCCPQIFFARPFLNLNSVCFACERVIWRFFLHVKELCVGIKQHNTVSCLWEDCLYIHCIWGWEEKFRLFFLSSASILWSFSPSHQKQQQVRFFFPLPKVFLFSHYLSLFTPYRTKFKWEEEKRSIMLLPKKGVHWSIFSPCG